MLFDPKQVHIARDNQCRSVFDSGGDVLVIVRVMVHAGELVIARDEMREHDDVLEPQLGIKLSAHVLADLGIGERLQDFIGDSCG